MNNDIAFTVVDELGMINAQIADLEKRATAIKDAMKDIATSPNGDKVFEGQVFKATVVESNRNTVNYKKLMADLGIDETILVDYTTVTAVFAVKVTGR